MINCVPDFVKIPQSDPTIINPQASISVFFRPSRLKTFPAGSAVIMLQIAKTLISITPAVSDRP